MSVKSTTSSASDQGGVALTPVQKAEAAVVKLEAEKEWLVGQIEAKKDEVATALSKCKCDVSLSDALDNLYEGEDKVVKARLAGLAKLEGQLGSVNTQLETARKTYDNLVTQQTLAIQQQTTQAIKRDHAAANLGPSGFSPEQQRSRGNVSPRAVPQLQAPGQESNGFKFTARVLNGLNAKMLRRNIINAATACLAFGGHIRYPAAPSFVPGCSSVLEIELYFMAEAQAYGFNASLCNCVGKYRCDILCVADVVITSVTHSFDPAHQITCNTYKPGDSPGRERDTAITLPSDSHVTTTVLTEEVVENESLVNRSSYDPARGPEWCHIKERPDCRDGEETDEANRLVMHAGLHKLYDGKNTHDDRCPPGMSVYCRHNDLPTGDFEDGTYQPVTVRVIFALADVANYGHIYLRNCVKITPRVFQCTFSKKNPARFVSYLNTRHANNVVRQPALSDPTDLVLSQGTSDDVGNLNDVPDDEDN